MRGGSFVKSSRSATV